MSLHHHDWNESKQGCHLTSFVHHATTIKIKCFCIEFNQYSLLPCGLYENEFKRSSTTYYIMPNLTVNAWVSFANFRMTKKISEYFMTYEVTKVFAIRRMKTQFTNKNTHILRTDVLQKHAVP